MTETCKIFLNYSCPVTARPSRHNNFSVAAAHSVTKIRVWAHWVNAHGAKFWQTTVETVVTVVMDATVGVITSI